MKRKAIKALISTIADQIECLRTTAGIAAVTRELAEERATNIVVGLLPLLEQGDALLRESLRRMGAAALKLGDAHAEIDRAGDAIATELEALLAGHACDNCGREIADQGGTFVQVDGEVVIECGRCDEPKTKAG